jgi:hypothetical protein
MSALATDGTGYLFGLTDYARVAGDAGPVRLELSAITDVHGNRIDFHYARVAGSDAPLLSAITWNDGQARVVLNYEARPDILVSHATGQRLVLAHRIKTIRTEVAGEPVRTTTLTYARSIEAPSSRLATIATVAADGAALPTWRMTYTGEAATPIAHEILAPRRSTPPRRAARGSTWTATRSPISSTASPARGASARISARRGSPRPGPTSRRPPCARADDPLRRSHRRRRARPARAAIPGRAVALSRRRRDPLRRRRADRARPEL